MTQKTTPTRYSPVAIFLHWLIAICVLGLLGVGAYMVWAPKEILGLAARFNLYQWHKSFGALVLGLMVLRLFWRLTHKAPELPATLKPWERMGARISHYGLYVLLIAMPLTGWAVVSTAAFNVPTLLFQKLYVPHINFLATHPEKAFWSELSTNVHGILAGLIAAIILAHIAAALKHHLINKDDILQRMLPKKKS